MIEAFGKECFDFRILALYKTRGNWSHAENNILQKVDALTMVDADNYRLFLNKQIGPTRWIPKDYDGSLANDIVRDIIKEITLEFLMCPQNG